MILFKLILFKLQDSKLCIFIERFNEIRRDLCCNKVVTSQHDTGRVSEMFLTLKSNYRRYKNSSLFFRYLVSDLCWPTINGMLEIMNMETIHDYSKSYYDIITNKDYDLLISEKGLLSDSVSFSD
jgi:hypothetical protein